MIVEYIRYALTTHSAEELIAAYSRAQAHLRNSPNALGWELARCAEDPSALVMRIEWDSAAGHMSEFRTSEHFRRFFADVRPFVGEIAEMRHYELTGVASTEAQG